MVQCKKILHAVFSYETPKIVAIHSLAIGVISKIIQLGIIAYIIGYVIVYKKGYQDVSEVRGTVVTKVKGVAYTDFPDDKFNKSVPHKELYRRVWDVADYVVPPSETGSVFVATNVLITPNQTQTVCPEDPTIDGALCDPKNNTCKAGESLLTGNGVMNGECVKNDRGGHSCQIHAWCPVEKDVLPLAKGMPLLEASKNFTLLIKNFVEFPLFKDSRRRNIRDTSKKDYLQKCLYDEVKNVDCPVFRLGDIVAFAGENYTKIASKGGVIGIVINWDCNFDWNKKYCFPTYQFHRLDDPNATLAKGWNFRYAQYYGDNNRTLYKLYGIKFLIILQGQAGKFMIIPLLLNIGAGLGLLSVNIVLCDLVALYIAKKRELYKAKKYEDVLEGDMTDCLIVHDSKRGSTPQPSSRPSAGDPHYTLGYE